MSMTFGVLETVRGDAKPFRVRTKRTVYPFGTWDGRDAFVRAEGITLVERAQFDRLPDDGPAYDESALDRPPTGKDETSVAEAKVLAREQLPLLAHACKPAAAWWGEVSEANGRKVGLLLQLVRGLRQFDRRHRDGGGLLPIDWINEARAVAHDVRLLDPDGWLDRIERRHLFEEQ
jgi:hypothetical protein